MALLTIPTLDEPFYTQTVALSGVPYLFDWRYSQRENAWYFSLSLEGGTVLVAGIKVVCGVSLVGRFANRFLPPGEILAVANGNDSSVPGLGELGTDKRVTLYYAEPV